MKMHLTIAMLLCVVATSAAAAAGQPAMEKGGALVDKAGMTLYTFDKDVANSGKSVCNGMCATNWPPLAAGEYATASHGFSVITRDDGTKQWAYKGKPLYYFRADKKPGDKNGDNKKNVWHIARD